MTKVSNSAEVNKQLEHLFRTQSGRIVSRLVRMFGSQNIDLAENVVQEALIAAMKNWPFNGIPENPAAWIVRVAKNKALDALKHNRFLCNDSNAMEFPVHSNEEKLKNEFLEDELKLLFISCHPILPPESQVALALKTVCGFGIEEIARAFFAKEETIAQRLVRAKQKIRAANLEFELPPAAELKERIENVYQTIYLMFSEGYAATSGDDLIRRDVCFEAIRLTDLLLRHPVGQRTETHALLALMLFQSSRFDSRIDNEGHIVLLEDQNREQWDAELIHAALSHMEQAGQGNTLSCYHIEAGIAACHATAKSFQETNWEHILNYYALLLQFKDSAIVRLNKAVAFGMKNGLEAGIAEIAALKKTSEFTSSMLFPASLADFYRRAERFTEAKKYYQAALLLAKTEPEKKFLAQRIQDMQQKL